MFATYLIISLILIIIGLASSMYLIRFLKRYRFEDITATALSESFSTIFIGIFYLYCAIITLQNVSNSTPMITPNEDETITIEETQNDTTYEDNFTNVDLTTIKPSLNDIFLHYQNLLKNIVKANKSREFRSIKFAKSRPVYEECFDAIFTENSMFLYSFFHSVISLIINVIKPPRENKPADTQDTPKNSATTNEENVGKCKTVVKILIVLLTPILSVIIFYVIMGQNMQINLINQIFNTTGIDSDSIFSIIDKPINVSASEKTQEITEVIRNVYKIVNSTQKRTPPVKLSSGYYLNTKRTPKLIEKCSVYNTFYHLYVLAILVVYFLVILYIKVTATKIQIRDVKSSKQLNVSLVFFAIFWVFSILQMFLKSFLGDFNGSILLSDISLFMGNLNQLSIIGMNCARAKEIMKRYNLVEPKA